MKIAYINSFYAPQEIGGAEKSVRFLAETMAARGHSAQVITLGERESSERLNGVDIARTKCANLYFPAHAGAVSTWRKMLWHSIDSYNLLAESKIGSLLDEFKPDLVHTNNLSGFSVSAWSASKKRNIPIIHTLRDYYLLCPSTSLFKNGSSCTERCTSCKVLSKPKENAASAVDTVIGNSQFILNKHLDQGLFGAARHGVIYNAYAPTDTAQQRNPNVLTLGFIGRLAPTKGLEVLIDAAKGITTSTTFKLLIAGEGESNYVAALKQRATGLNVEFVGRVAPAWFYNQVHWTIVPSTWDEPLARVLFESYAHGAPVIGSATGGTPELITQGVTGLMYHDALNPNALAEKLLTALNMPKDEYASLSEACTAKSQQFSPDRVYTRYMEQYELTIAAKQPS